MARWLVCFLVASVLLGGCISVHETKRVCEDKSTPAYEEAPVQLLRHVVMFKFKEGTTAADIRRIENAFCALPTKIDAIYDFEWGTDVSVENRTLGFTHCFVVTFRGEEDRATYLPHPAHKAFGEVVHPHLDDVLVVDFWSN